MIPNDLPGLDFDLGETADMLRDTVRGFAADEIAPRAAEIDRTNEFPRDLWPKLGALGLLGITVEEEYGGAGMGYLAHMRRDGGDQPRLGLGRPVLRRALQPLRQPDPPQRHAGAEARATCPKLISGEHVGALAMSEPGAGSDVVGMTLARRASAATATSSTAPRCGSPTAPTPTSLVVYAKTDPDAGPRGHHRLPGREGLQGLLAPRRSSTSSACAAPTPASWCSRTARCRPRTCSGERRRAACNVLMSGLDYERAVLAGGPLGIMQACMDVVLPYVHERKQFGQPIGEFQLMQGKLADMYTDA